MLRLKIGRVGPLSPGAEHSLRSAQPALWSTVPAHTATLYGAGAGQPHSNDNDNGNGTDTDDNDNEAL